MLEMALRAGLPLVCTHTTDTVNVHRVLSHLAGGETFVTLEQAHLKKMLTAGFQEGRHYFYIIGPAAVDWDALYEALEEQGRTLVVVNPEECTPTMFNAGEASAPAELVAEDLSEVVEEDAVPGLAHMLGGLTLKDVQEICRMASAEHGDLTPRSVMDVRRLVASTTKGLHQVDTSFMHYVPPPFLAEWVQVDGRCFSLDLPDALVPRGLLLDGPPGTGKTMAAKYLANYLGVPLFRLDVGSMMGKWVGDSEAALRSALGTVDQTAPCVLLIDEAEKPFKGGDDAGVTSRMLSGLLWWLQEHRTRVLTVMTTNDKSALPAEAYRPGRIDQVVYLGPVEDWGQAINFMAVVLTKLQKLVVAAHDIDRKAVLDDAQAALKWDDAGRTYAQLTAAVTAAFKRALLFDKG